MLRLFQHCNVRFRFRNEGRQVEPPRRKDAVLLGVEAGRVEDNPKVDVEIQPVEQPLADVGFLEGRSGKDLVTWVDDPLVGSLEPGDLDEGYIMLDVESSSW